MDVHRRHLQNVEASVCDAGVALDISYDHWPSLMYCDDENRVVDFHHLVLLVFWRDYSEQTRLVMLLRIVPS